jgi:hypothetical protein
MNSYWGLHVDMQCTPCTVYTVCMVCTEPTCLADVSAATIKGRQQV